jgi:aspartate/methionine/tyrosine aminotransferase
MSSLSFPPLPREQVASLRVSEIREVANAGLGRNDILAFWFGESDQATPAFIREAAARALTDGRTFYTHNLGTPELRAALSAYLSGLHGRPIGTERICVVSAGVNALMLAAQAVVSPGDKVAVVTPVWPNVAEIPRILGARMAAVPLAPVNGRWSLDVGRLIETLTPDTRALFLNSPNNPTGWALPAEDRAVILDHCRKHGIWIIADDVYERLTFGTPTAPSFLQVAGPEDRVISTNSFSKAWRMTGWRLGWMVVPPALMDAMGVLIEYNTSCAPDFVQAGAVVALTDGEPHVESLRAELIEARDMVLGTLRTLPMIEAPSPDGGLYSFFRVRGCADSLGLAKQLVAEAGVGLAPGSAFGDEGQGWLRWCFAKQHDRLREGLDLFASQMELRNVE